MGSINRKISRYETTLVYSHPDAKVDIILIHGLNGCPSKTWTASNGCFWPTDLLPASLKGEAANIMVYGYNADVYSRKNDRSASNNFILQHAQTLVTSLTLFRRSEGGFRRPIIWICHSLGGILIKRAVLYSNDLRSMHHEDYRSIFVSTFGFMFLGTPHTGSDMASWSQTLQAMSDAIMPKKFFESESVLLKTLKKDNETLSNINNHFLDIYQRFRIHMVHENHKTDIKGTKVIVVDANSASPQLPGVTYYGVEATHAQMCKFSDSSAPGYRALSTDIYQWVLDAPALIAVRWEAEEQDRLNRMRNEIHEKMSPLVSQSPILSVTRSRRGSDISTLSSSSMTLGQSTLAQSTLAPTSMGQTTLAPTSMGQTTLTPNSMGQTTMTSTSMGQTTLTPTSMGQTTLTPTSMGQSTLTPTSMGQATLTPVTLASTVPRALIAAARPDGVFVLDGLDESFKPVYRLSS